MNIKWKDWFTIPNILVYIRILLLPVFIYIYLHAEGPEDYIAAALVIGVQGLTDLFDGMIARKFTQITELGKFLDPVADKLTQGTWVFCLLSRYPMMWVLAGFFVVKEGFMLVMGAVMLRHNGRKLDGALWCGKVCTTVLDISMFLLLLLPILPDMILYIVITICLGFMLWSFVTYATEFRKMWDLERLIG